MKIVSKSTNSGIQLAVWQLFALVVVAMACLIAVGPLISQHRSTRCDTIVIEKTIQHQMSEPELPPTDHKRYARDANLRDQCGVIPPTCSATTTVSGTSTRPSSTNIGSTTTSTVPTTSTGRSTVSTVIVTRPVITTSPPTLPTTTPDPWLNVSRPYNTWRLPTFAKPSTYTLQITCPDCFTLRSNSSSITFNGQVTIQLDISNATQYLVLHSKDLNILAATITSGAANTAQITYVPEFEMIYLSFNNATIAAGQASLQLNYTGTVNEQDQTGLYRELFRKSTEELSYIVAGNFQPIYARRAFPCFDEPNMEATFTLTIDHPQNTTVALSNNNKMSSSASDTTFPTTTTFSTSSLALAILPLDDFVSVQQQFFTTTVNVWVRPELTGASNVNLEWTFDVIDKTLQFVQDYLNVPSGNLPNKLDFIGIPDLILDEKASATLGLLIFREELLSVDPSLNSAERQQTTTKILVEHILQIWFSKTNWWDNVWFGKSLSSFLAYKMIEVYYPSFNLMEQFPIREIVPNMMDDFKPSIWPVSNKNLTSNVQILDYLSTSITSKGASLLRLLDYVVGNDTFQAAVRSVLAVTDPSNVLTTFYSNLQFDPLLNAGVTVEDFLRTWLEERNYPLITIHLIRSNTTSKNVTVTFRQTRYIGSFAIDDSGLDPNYVWRVYMECDLGGSDDEGYNLTTNYEPSKLKFLFQSTTQTIELPDQSYLWVKCNKGFYSYHVTEYVSSGDDQLALWQDFELLFNEVYFSNNDRANLLNDAFVLPHGGEIVTYDQTINLAREMFANPVESYIPWSVFVWHWNYLMGVEEHSKYFRNFKQFATKQTLALFDFGIDDIVTAGANHQEKLLKSMFFELLCRVQDPTALNKATELFRLIPSSYFFNSTGTTGVSADYLATVIYYHLQNTNGLDEWDTLWRYFTENAYITPQQRVTFLRGLGSAKEVWRLKSLLEYAMNTDSYLVESQEFFDLIITASQNPNGRDVVWNFYRHNYAALLSRFGTTNRLFNQLITNIVQSFENEYYYFQMKAFIDQYPSASQNQRLALDQILINFEWLIDGLAENLDTAISAADRLQPKSSF